MLVVGEKRRRPGPAAYKINDTLIKGSTVAYAAEAEQEELWAMVRGDRAAVCRRSRALKQDSSLRPCDHARSHGQTDVDLPDCAPCTEISPSPLRSRASADAVTYGSLSPDVRRAVPRSPTGHRQKATAFHTSDRACLVHVGDFAFENFAILKLRETAG